MRSTAPTRKENMGGNNEKRGVQELTQKRTRKQKHKQKQAGGEAPLETKKNVISINIQKATGKKQKKNVIFVNIQKDTKNI